jgi:hypothetical protein
MSSHKARNVAELESVKIWKLCQSCDSTMRRRRATEFNNLELLIAIAVVVIACYNFSEVLGGRSNLVFFHDESKVRPGVKMDASSKTKDRSNMMMCVLS